MQTDEITHLKSVNTKSNTYTYFKTNQQYYKFQLMNVNFQTIVETSNYVNQIPPNTPSNRHIVQHLFHYSHTRSRARSYKKKNGSHRVAERATCGLFAVHLRQAFAGTRVLRPTIDARAPDYTH